MPSGAEAPAPQPPLSIHFLMTKLKIALAQMRCEKGDWRNNLNRTAELISRARSEGCDIIVFPEMGLSGYCDPTRFPHAVQPLDSPWIEKFVELTGQHDIVASGGFIERNPLGKPFITQVLARNGRIVGVYRKVNVVDEEADFFSPGCETPVFSLPLRGGVVQCALAVCADSDRPDLFRAFASAGAQIVFHSSAPGLYTRRGDAASWRDGFDWYRGHLFERLPYWARENRLHIAVATQTGATIDEDFPGGSFIFDSQGICVASVEDYAETLLVHELEIGR